MSASSKNQAKFYSVWCMTSVGNCSLAGCCPGCGACSVASCAQWALGGCLSCLFHPFWCCCHQGAVWCSGMGAPWQLGSGCASCLAVDGTCRRTVSPLGTLRGCAGGGGNLSPWSRTPHLHSAWWLWSLAWGLPAVCWGVLVGPRPGWDMRCQSESWQLTGNPPHPCSITLGPLPVPTTIYPTLHSGLGKSAEA